MGSKENELTVTAAMNETLGWWVNGSFFYEDENGTLVRREEEEQEGGVGGRDMNIISIVVPIFFSIVILVGFFGNLLVVLVVTFNKQMRNTTNLLILNLAVADILFIVFCIHELVMIRADIFLFPLGLGSGNRILTGRTCLVIAAIKKAKVNVQGKCRDAPLYEKQANGRGIPSKFCH